MPRSQAETPENETNSHAQKALSLDPWEAAYLRFETPEEEIQKFIGRLNRLGAPQWPRDAEIVELFCGRGNRSEEHTSELQSRGHLVCRLLLEKKKQEHHTDKSYST